MCDHTFVTYDAGYWHCHDCDFYFTKHPTELSPDLNIAAPTKDLVEATESDWEEAQAILKEKYLREFANQINKRSAFSDFCKPIVNTIYPKEIANEIVNVRP